MNYNFDCRIFIDDLYPLRKFSFITSFLKDFIIKEWWVLSNSFSGLTYVITWIFLYLVSMVDYIYLFSNIETALHPVIKHTWSWYIIISDWILLANIFLRNYVFNSWGISVCSSLVLSLSSVCITVILAHKMNWEWLLFFYFLEEAVLNWC